MTAQHHTVGLLGIRAIGHHTIPPAVNPVALAEKAMAADIDTIPLVYLRAGYSPDFVRFLKDNRHDYAAFGKVISGLEECDRIVHAERNRQDRPLTEQKMVKVTVETFGEEYPEPEKIKSRGF